MKAAVQQGEVSALPREIQAQPIGQIAIKIGLMTEDQVTEVCRAQTESNQLFGELAVQLGFLDQEQRILLIQQKHLHDKLVDEVLQQFGSMYGLVDWDQDEGVADLNPSHG